MATVSYLQKEQNRLENILRRSDLTETQKKATRRELNQVNIQLGDVRTSDVFKIEQAETSPIVKQKKSTVSHVITKPTIELTPKIEVGTVVERNKEVKSESGVKDFHYYLGKVVEGLEQGKEISKLLGQIPAQFVGGVTDVLPLVSEDILETSEDIGEVPPSLVKPSIEKVIIPSLEDVPGAVGTGAQDLLTSFTQGLQVGLSQIGTGVGTGVGEIGTGVGTGVGGIGKGLEDTLKGVLPYAVIGIIGYAIVKNI